MFAYRELVQVPYFLIGKTMLLVKITCMLQNCLFYLPPSGYCFLLYKYLVLIAHCYVVATM